MTKHGLASPFFNIPLELREQIFRDVLSCPSQGPNLLRTCREIYNEARKFLYHRPINFRNQERLYDWLGVTAPHFLRQVSMISLSIHDVDLQTILTTEDLTDEAELPVQLHTWRLYEAELDKLRSSFQKLPNVKTINIQASVRHQSFLYRDFTTAVLELLVSSYPLLMDLRLDGDWHHQDLAVLSRLQQLSSFTFDGFSSSTSTETADILGGLSNLRSLSLTSQHAILTPVTCRRSLFTEKHQSFTGDVARTMKQLASFAVTEVRPTPSPTLFLTSEILDSLHNHSTLDALSVQLSHPPDRDVLEALEIFIARSNIRRLELDWPNFKPLVLRNFQLASSLLRCLWVRVDCEADAFKILCSLAEIRGAGDVQELRKIVLVRSFVTSVDAISQACDRKDSGTGVSSDLLKTVSSGLLPRSVILRVIAALC
ncbi:hypothetical protein FB567DRAFT_441409 [Paraphoma chrysanthemicola]|uniref:Uncharacterized protein n=1 Tax=Paraphoma chrysanthemicola TaxID=798071 RepID=A0A8K0R719_9PLEO|nr:hypothetical protein FB567DRAFT_441409 [Paraphoma chrysanthemicola]